jgi:hypothetical protein
MIMGTNAKWAVALLEKHLAKWGQTITLRRMTRLGSAPNFVINPPNVSTLFTDHAAAIGTAELDLIAASGTSVQGFLAMGDLIAFGDDPTPYVIQAPVAAAFNRFSAVRFNPGLGQAVSAGERAGLNYLADQSLKAWVRNFDIRHLDGDLIRSGDVLVHVPAASLVTAPSVGDIIFVGPARRTILSVDTAFTGDGPAQFEVHAR